MAARPITAPQLMAGTKVGSVDLDAKTEADWHGVAGSRLERTEKVLQCDIESFIIITQLVLLEPIEIMTHLFMGYSNRVPNYAEWPPLLDMLWGPTSIVQWVLQYYSGVLTGRCGRLSIILARCGVCSLGELHDKMPDRHRYIRNLTLMIIGLVEMRHVEDLEGDSLRCYALGDRLIFKGFV